MVNSRLLLSLDTLENFSLTERLKTTEALKLYDIMNSINLVKKGNVICLK